MSRMPYTVTFDWAKAAPEAKPATAMAISFFCI